MLSLFLLLTDIKYTVVFPSCLCSKIPSVSLKLQIVSNPMYSIIKFSLYVRYSKRLTIITNNKIGQLWQCTVIKVMWMHAISQNILLYCTHPFLVIMGDEARPPWWDAVRWRTWALWCNARLLWGWLEHQLCYTARTDLITRWLLSD